MYDRIKGFRDFYPGEMSARRATIDVLEETARAYGFREIGTPALERAELWTDKSGDEIVDELYSFEDQGGRHVAMTPELTPTVARMVVAKQQELSKPIKWVSTRPFWRYEQVQQGRQREFYQTNVDIFGSSAPEADAEISRGPPTPSLASDSPATTSVSDLPPGTSSVASSSYDADVDTEAAIRAVDKSGKISAVEYHDLLIDAGLSADQAAEFDDLIADGDLEAVDAFADTERVTAAVENLQNVLAAAEDFGAREYCTVSLETARGLDYYTGVVFECFDSAGEVSRSIFGGGRYDDLIGGLRRPADARGRRRPRSRDAAAPVYSARASGRGRSHDGLLRPADR